MMDEVEKRKLCVETGERVRRYREESGLTKERLAEAVGISTQYVSDIEQGRKCMSFAIFVELARLFHVNLDTLAFGRGREDPAVGRAADYLLDLRPLERDMAAQMLLDAARAVMAMRPED